MPSPRAAATTSTAARATYYTDNNWLGDIRQTVRAVPTNARGRPSPSRGPATTATRPTWWLPLGGPIKKDKVWFFAGYAPQYYPAERTVTWTNPGTFPATQTFDNGEPNNIDLQLQRHLAARPTPLRARFTGNNETQKGALGLPAIEPNGTSTASAATLQPALLGVHRAVPERLQRHHRLGGDREDLRQRDGGLSRLRPAQRRWRLLPRHAPHLLHHQRRQAGVPAEFQNVNGFADNNSNSFTVADDYQRFNLSADVTRFAQWKGEHAFKIGGLYERIGNFADLGQQHVNIAFKWNSTLVTTQNVPVTGTYGYFVASRHYTDGDIKETNLSFYAQDAWTVNNKLTVNYGVRLEKEEIPSYNPNAPGVELRVGRQDRAACRVRLRHQGRRQMEGVRLVRPVLRHHEARHAARRVGRRKVGQLLLHARHASTGSRLTARVRTARRAATAAGSSNRSTSATPRTSRAARSARSIPNLQPTQKHEYTFGLDHELGARMSLGVRYVHKGWDQTIDDIGVCAPGSQTCGEVYNIGEPWIRHRQDADSRSVPIGAEGAQHLQRARVRRAQALLEQLAGHVEHRVQPPVWQLRRTRELGRKRPHLPERQPLLRFVVPVVRPDGRTKRSAA